MAKVLSLALGVSIGVGIFLAYMWYAYVTNTRSPYDDLGTELNAWMPQSLNEWGCGRLRATFPEARPPQGCEGADGAWRAPPAAGS